MKKLALGVLTLSLVLMVVGMVSAAISGVGFITPSSGSAISGSSYLITWSNNDTRPDLDLQYKLGGCASANPWQDLAISMGTATTSYMWDVSGFNDIACLRIYETVNSTVESGDVAIDNIAPVADATAGEPYTCNEADMIVLDASASTDNYTGIALYEWEIDGDGIYDGTGVNLNYTCPDGPAVETITLRVTDLAGNTDTTTTSVTISNVAPVCNGITAFADSAVTEPVTFTENATDVADALTYSWNFNDSTTNTSNPSVHVFNTAGTYNVTVTVSDGTDTCLDSHLITIVDPTPLPEQEVMALQNLNANFTPMEGAVANSFATNLIGGVSCAKRITSSMSIAGNGNDCVVTWNSVPNSENGKHLMVVRVDNGTDYEYYTFNTTVWSYMINLTAGWNLISIPVVPEDNTIQTVIFDQLYDALPGGYDYVVWSYQYDGSSSKWLKSRRTGYGDLDYIEPGYAYWINMDNADILYGYGDKLIEAQSPPSIKIVSGWNLIGHYGLLSVAIDNALTSIVPYKDTVLDETGFPVAGNLDPMEGYWLSTTGLLDGQSVQYTPSNESYNFN